MSAQLDRGIRPSIEGETLFSLVRRIGCGSLTAMQKVGLLRLCLQSFAKMSAEPRAGSGAEAEMAAQRQESVFRLATSADTAAVTTSSGKPAQQSVNGLQLMTPFFHFSFRILSGNPGSIRGNAFS
jgi:hypothetical protein